MSITISTELPIKSNEIITSIGQQNFIRTADNIRLEEYEINTGVIVKDIGTTADLLSLIGRPKTDDNDEEDEIEVTSDLEIELDTTSLNFDKPLIVLNNQFNAELYSDTSNWFIPTTYKFILSNQEFFIDTTNNTLYIWFKTQDSNRLGNSNVKFFRDELIWSYQKIQVTAQTAFTNMHYQKPYNFVSDFQVKMRLSFTLFYMEKKIIW